MRRLKRKLVVIVTFSMAAFLLFVPGPTTNSRSGRFRTDMRDDHLTLFDTQLAKDSIFKRGEQNEVNSVPLRSSLIGENPTLEEHGIENVLALKHGAQDGQKTRRSQQSETSSRSVGPNRDNFPILIARDRNLIPQSSIRRLVDSNIDLASRRELLQALKRRRKFRRSQKEIKYVHGFKVMSKESAHFEEGVLPTEGSFGKVSDQMVMTTPTSSRGKYRLLTEFKKWIILDGLRQPCSDVSVYTLGWADWRVVLVNNGFTSVRGCKPEYCQIHQGSDLNQAYLKAITSGADVIVLADCLARYPQLDQNFRVKDVYQYGMYYNGSNTFNPYEYAGYEAVFPKSTSLWEHPLNSSADWSKPLSTPAPNSEMFYISDFGRVSFRQGFRLGEDICVCEFVSSFNASATEVLDNPVVAGDNTLVMLDTGPSLVLPDAFYWLFIPSGLSRSAVHSYRTFWLHALKRAGLIHTGVFRTDALMNPIGGDATKIPKLCVDKNNPQSTMNIVDDNQNGYTFTATKKVAFHCVQKTSCKPHMDELTCAIHLSLDVLKCLGLTGHPRNYLQEHIKAIHAWFKQLTDIYVPLPKPRPLRVDEKGKNTFRVKYNVPRQHLYRSFKHNSTTKLQQHQRIQTAVVEPMLRKCPDLGQFKFPNSWGSAHTKNSDIAIVVTLNTYSLFTNIVFLEFLYRQSFRFILYCGPNMAEFTNFVKEHGGLDHVTYIDGGWSGSNGWHTIYRCLTLAMKMRLPVKGYLQVNEDVLLNSKKVAMLPRQKAWIVNEFNKLNVSSAGETAEWHHWSKPWGRKALTSLFTQLQTSANFVSPSHNNNNNNNINNNNNNNNVDVGFGDNVYEYEDNHRTLRSPVPGRTPHDVKRAANRFLQNYAANLGGLDTVVNRATDFFYVPETWRDNYIILAEVFQYTGVMIEFAFPMLHLGMTLRENVNYVRGPRLWREERDTPWKFYHETLAFLHPFNPRLVLENKDGLRFFCDSFLRDYEEWVHRLNK